LHPPANTDETLNPRDEDTLRVRREQARAVYDALPLTFFVNTTMGAALAIALKDEVAPHRLLAWLGLLVLVQLLRWWSLRAFRSLQHNCADFRSWVRLAVGGAAASGIIWGLASLFLWSESDLGRQAVLMVMVAGMVAGAITTLAPILAAALSFLYCALVPLIWRLAVIHTAGDGQLLFMTMLFLLMMTITARRSNRLLLASLRTQVSKERADEKIRYQANYDELTGLANRRHLVKQLKRELSRSQRHHWIGALLFLDIDNFKDVNDSLGHAAGDQLLKDIASRITARLRAEDTACRLGGDEFVLLFPELTKDKDEALFEVDRIAKQLMEAISSRLMINGHEIQVTASVGIAFMPADGRTPEDLLKHADTAMYRAKENGRAGYQIFVPEMQRAIRLRLYLEKELRHAIANDQMRLHYQPQVDLSGNIRSLEALVRWEHPDKGLIMPNDFIGVAEQTGLVVELSRWVIMRAARDMMTIKRSVPADKCPSMAINISANDFRRGAILDLLGYLSGSAGFQKGDFRLELTEHTVMENYEAVIQIMRTAQELGFSFAIDDFGTGYSSLAYLKRLPVDVLKIDRSFVKDLLDDVNDAVIVQTIIGMAGNLGLDTVAEGVETAEIHEALKELGCQNFQGWYFGSPEPLDCIVRRLRSSQRTEAHTDSGALA
jgi:diguanylate cyclase (GGDEF)-like protein